LAGIAVGPLPPNSTTGPEGSVRILPPPYPQGQPQTTVVPTGSQQQVPPIVSLSLGRDPRANSTSDINCYSSVLLSEGSIQVGLLVHPNIN
jgi:hypothetical protein